MKEILDAIEKEKVFEHIKNVVCFDPVSEDEENQALLLGINLKTFKELIIAGQMADASQFPLEETQNGDTYMLSYTSGTTGLPKGVKITHNNVISN